MNESNTTSKAEGRELLSMCDSLNNTGVEIVDIIICIFIFVTSLFGNTLVILVVHRNRQMRTIVDLLMANMAFSDLLCTLIVIPQDLTQKFTYPGAWMINGSIGEASCEVAYFLQDVTVAVSLLSLLLIAIERYDTISRPVIADPRQYKRSMILIASSWITAFLMYSTSFYTFKLLLEDEGPICTNSWKPLLPDAYEAWKIEFLLHTIFFAFIPFVVITSLYTIILVKMRRMPMTEGSSSAAKQRREKRNQKVLRVLVIVVIAYGVCWFPYISYVLVGTYVWRNMELDPRCVFLIFGRYALYLAYLNSSVNPVLYFTFRANYREAAASILRACLSSFSTEPRKQTGTKKIDTPHQKRAPKAGLVEGKAEEIELGDVKKL